MCLFTDTKCSNSIRFVWNNSRQEDKDVSETNNLLARLHAET